MENTATLDAAVDAIVSLIHDQPAPITPAALHKLIPADSRPKQAELPALLEQQVESGRLYQFPPYRGKAPRYWDRDLETYATGLILKKFDTAGEELTLSAVFDKVKGELKGYKKGDVELLLNKLQEQGDVLKLPRRPGSRGDSYSTGSVRVAPYLKDAVARIRQQADNLQTAGVTAAEVFEEAVRLLREALKLNAEPSIAELLERLRTLETDQGGPLTEADLESGLEFQELSPAARDRLLDQLVAGEQLYRQNSEEAIRYSLQPFPTKTAEDPAPAAEPESGSPAESEPAPQRPRLENAADYQAALLQAYEELKPGPDSTTRTVPIYLLREKLTLQYGREAATHEALDQHILALREAGFQIIPISNLIGILPSQIENALPGAGGEIPFYVEPV